MVLFGYLYQFQNPETSSFPCTSWNTYMHDQNLKVDDVVWIYLSKFPQYESLFSPSSIMYGQKRKRNGSEKHCFAQH